MLIFRFSELTLFDNLLLKILFLEIKIFLDTYMFYQFFLSEHIQGVALRMDYSSLDIEKFKG